MRKNLIINLLIISSLYLSCNKDNTLQEAIPDCSPVTKENIIGRYIMTVYEEKTATGTVVNVLSQYKDCEKDDIYILMANDSIHIEASIKKCDNNTNEIVKRGFYKIDYDNSRKEYRILAAWSWGYGNISLISDWGPVTCVTKNTITFYEEILNSNGSKQYIKIVWSRV